MSYPNNYPSACSTKFCVDELKQLNKSSVLSFFLSLPLQTNTQLLMKIFQPNRKDVPSAKHLSEVTKRENCAVLCCSVLRCAASCH